MRSGSVWLIGLAGAALSNAVALDKRDGPAVLTVPMIRENHTPRHLSKRSKTIAVDASLGSVDTPTYLANMTFGTPPQDFRANLDLWEDQSWIKSVYGSSCAKFYRHDPSDCDGYGGYNQSRSTTAKKNGKFSNDDEELDLKGDYVIDAFSIGGVDVDEMKLGVITSSEIISNTLGLGYGDNSLPNLLVNAGLINTPAFSVYREMALFGGVNKAQYNGSLYTFPIVNGKFNGTERKKAHRINLDGITINDTAVASFEFERDAIFDVVFDLTYFPKSIVQSLYTQIGLKNPVPDDYGQVNFSCNAVSDNTTIGFKFGDLDLEFNLFSNFVSQERFTQSYRWSPDQKTCYLTICENIDFQNEGSVVLGANFLNAVYAVFDLQNEEVSLAKLPYGYSNETANDIVEITSDGVAGAVKDSAGRRVVGDLRMTALIVATAMLIVTF